MVAAFGDLQIGVMARGELEALFGHQVDERVGHRRRGVVHGLDDLLVLVRAGDGEHARMGRG